MKYKKVLVDMKNKLLILTLVALTIIGVVIAQNQSLEEELASLEEELVNAGFDWLVNATIDENLDTSTIEVFTQNGNETLAVFENIQEEKFYKIYLTNLNGTQDVFDLRINGSIEFDQILDPAPTMSTVKINSTTNASNENLKGYCNATDADGDDLAYQYQWYNGSTVYLNGTLFKEGTISTGNLHTCGIRANDSRVLCWGEGANGRLGDEGTGDNTVPNITTDNSPYSSVSAGYIHTCGIRANDSRVLCWGYGGSGRLGDGDSTSHNVSNPNLTTDSSAYLSVSSGISSHTCGIRANDSRVLCWGDSGSGKLGDGQASTDRTSPYPTTDNSSYSSVSAGYSHTCGIRTNDSRILCWGQGDYGQLGDGSTSAHYSSDPNVTTDSSAYANINAGDYHTCGIRANDSRVLCWGTGDDGQVGDGTSTERTNPTLTSDTSAYSSISAGGDNALGRSHTCGIRASDGRVLCWGDGGYYQTGDGGTTDNTVPTLTSDSSPYKKGFSSGEEILISILGNSFLNKNNIWKLSCRAYDFTEYSSWMNSSTVTISDGRSPIMVINSPQNITYTTSTIIFNITATDESGVGVCKYSLDGATNKSMTNITASQWNATNSSMTNQTHTVKFYCNDSLGNMGDTQTIFRINNNPIVQTATINSTTNKSNESIKGYCNATDTDGDDLIYQYQWYNGSTVYYNGTLFKEDSISASFEYTCGIRASDSRVLCWGEGSYGRQGDGSTTDNLVPTLTSDISPYISVSTGYQHTCGIRVNDSRVLCWGESLYGRLGDGQNGVDVLNPNLTTDNSSYISVSAGYYFSCGIRANDSRVLCWGDSLYGQLGDGQTTFDMNTSTLTTDTSAYSSISAGYQHTCGIRVNDSRVLCWGETANGRVGDGQTTTDRTSPYQTTDSSAYSSVSAGSLHTCGIRANDSRVLCWGESLYGRLGDGQNGVDVLNPNLTTDSSAYTSISAGMRHTCGIRTNDSRILCWGEGEYGRLGDGNNSIHNVVSPNITTDSSVYSSVSAGDYHTCGIRASDGRVLCWGQSDYYQLGDGQNTLDRNESTLTTDTSAYKKGFGSGNETLVSILGNAFIKKGEIWKMGCRAYDFNGYSSWMNSSTITILSGPPTMATVKINSTTSTTSDNINGYCNATDKDGDDLAYQYQWYNGSTVYFNGTIFKDGSISTGYYFSCGIRANDSRVLCWGQGLYGQLGDGQNTINRTSPYLTTDISSYKMISAGYYHTCGIRANDSRVLCWGETANGRVGDGQTTTDRTSPYQTTDTSAYSSISAGLLHTCGIRTNDSRVLCWGESLYGRLGDGQNGVDVLNPNVTTDNSSYFSVSAGGYHSCGIRANDSRVLCWGYGLYGQVGNSGTTDNLIPNVTTDTSSYKSASAGYYHTCGIRNNDSRVLCWGRGDWGNLGDSEITNNLVPNLTTDTSPYTIANAGYVHTCGIRTNDSRVLCWGYGANGQVGDGETTNNLVPNITTDSSIYSSVSPGGYHTCGIRANDSRVLCWGYGTYGQLGDGNNASHSVLRPNITTSSSPYKKSFSSSEEILVSILGNAYLNVGENWSLGCRSYDFTDYSSWMNSSILTINFPPVIQTVKINSTTNKSNENIKGYCNATDTDGNDLIYNYTWYNGSTAYINGTLFKEGTISAGYGHSCGIRANDSRVLCWGEGSNGRQGDGQVTDNLIPTLTTDISAYSSVSAGGYFHTCGIRANDSRVLCWGDSAYGQIGDGQITTDRTSPYQTTDTSAYSSISAGDFHTCGIRANDSRVLCWGESANGRLGNGQTTPDQSNPNVTTDTSAYSSISAGEQHTCGIRANDSRVLCWGDSAYGQLGDGQITTDRTSPYLTTDSSAYSSISAGGIHTCGIRTNDSRVLCWGESLDGRLWDGQDGVNVLNPNLTTDSSAYTSISAGGYHTCGIRQSDSRVLCWGYSAYGALGSVSGGLTTDSSAYLSVSAGGDSVRIRGHTCGIRANDSRVLCWGESENGRLGDGQDGVNVWNPNLTTDSSAYKKGFFSGEEVLISTLMSSFITAGESWKFSCSAYDFIEYSSWVNSTAMTILSSPPTMSTVKINSTTNTKNDPIYGYCNATDEESDDLIYQYQWYNGSTVYFNGTLFKDGSISAGWYHTCGIRQNDSRVLCWGRGDNGRLGDGITANHNNSNPNITTDSSAYSSVSAGYTHTCGIRSNDSRILCWGYGLWGNLGDGETTDNSNPNVTTDFSAYLSISAGYTHTCGIRANDSRVLCWGRGNYGTLGDGSTSTHNTLNPNLTTDTSAYSSVSAGYVHTCGIRTNDSRVLCWGYGNFGHLGDGSTSAHNVGNPNITTSTSPYSSISASAGYHHTCGIRANDSRVLCWGYGNIGQLGDGSATAHNNSNPNVTTDSSSYSSISAGGYHNCGIRANDSRVLCWGYGTQGQLGDGAGAGRPNPTLISGSSIYSSVSAGSYYHTCGIRANDSRVLCWGYGNDGELGDGSTASHNVLNPNITTDSSPYKKGFSSSEEVLVSILGNAYINAGQNWSLGCRSYDFSSYSDWMNSSVMTINTAPVMQTVKINSTTNTSTESIKGYCNATDFEGSDLGYQYQWYNGSTLSINGTIFKEGSISAGWYSACGIRANDSRVVCWGYGAFGVLGDGSTTDNLIPNVTADTSAYKSVSVGDSHACGIRQNDSRVLCWGRCSNDACGDGQTTIDRYTPYPMTDSSEYLMISASNYYTCGIRANDSRVLCWGWGDRGEMGDGISADHTNPIATLTTDTSGYKFIITGDDSSTHSCGIRANDSRVLCWGEGSDGQLGDGDNSSHNNPNPNITTDSSAYTSIALGYLHTCGIRANDSRVLCWGNGYAGQLGDGIIASHEVGNPTLINDASPYLIITSGYENTCGIRQSDKRVLCWGSGTLGGIGNGNNVDVGTPTLTLDSSAYSRITGGFEYYCGIRTNDSRVLCWGYGDYGALGDSSTAVHNTLFPNLTVDNSSYVKGFSSGNETLVSTLASSFIKKGENWKISCRAYDFTSYSSWMNSTAMTILNGPPVMATVKINSTTNTKNDSIYGYCNATDKDEDDLAYQYQWYNGSTVYFNGTIFKEGSISTGHYFSCGIRANDSRVLCWGQGLYGQLGDGQNTINRTSPYLTTDISSYSSISTGYFHACGIRANDSRVLCWGRGEWGNLGDSEITNNLVPNLTTDSSAYSSVSAGGYHTCGIRANDSRVLCWGYGNFGELGDSETGNNLRPNITTDSSSYSNINTGGYHTCGIRTNDSRVLCWGYGLYGQRGDGQTTNTQSNPNVTKDTSAYSSISAGEVHTCGIRANDSRVLCWGESQYGRLGDTQNGVDVLNPNLTTDSSPYTIANAGYLHTCGIRQNDSRVLCWGYGANGQLGDGENPNNLIPNITTDSSIYSSVSPGGYHTCGIRANDSRVLCWGFGTYGQLGDGSNASHNTLNPNLTTDSSPYKKGFSSSEEVLVSILGSAYLNVGQNWSFGCRAYDFTNYSSWMNSSILIVNTAPIMRTVKINSTTNSSTENIKGYCNATDFEGSNLAYGYTWYNGSTVYFDGTYFRKNSLALGENHVCGIRANDSRVLCWGDSAYGQLGDGQTTTDRASPYLTNDSLEYLGISAEKEYTCGIRANDSRVLCWGKCDFGRCGDGNLTTHNNLNLTLTTDTSAYASISVGEDHVCGIRANDSRVLCWGECDSGKCGDGNISNHDVGNPNLTTDTSAYSIIAAGGYHTCGIRANDSRVLCWGLGGNGELGNGSISDSGNPQITSDNSAYSMITTGYILTCGIRKSDSRVLCWGYCDQYGTCGDGNFIDHNNLNPTLTTDSSSYSTVKTNDMYACGIRNSDSRVLCWGYNYYGTLGDGTTTDKADPTLTTDNSAYLDVNMNYHHTCGIRANDSRVLCWGNNWYGELGNGTTSSYTSYSPRVTVDTSPYISDLSVQGNETLVSILGSAFLNAGETWKFGCRAYDFSSYSSWMNSSTMYFAPPSCEIQSITELTNTSYQDVDGNYIWYYNPSYDGSVQILVNTTDTDVDTISFPTTVSAGANDTTDPYSVDYTWDTADTYNQTTTITINDSSGNLGNCSFDIYRDSGAPIYHGYNYVGGASYVNGTDYWVTGGDNFLIKVNHSDVGSGVWRQYFGYNKDDCNPNGCGGSPYEIKSYKDTVYADWYVNNSYLDIISATCNISECYDSLNVSNVWNTTVALISEDWDFKMHTYEYDMVTRGLGYTDMGIWLKVDNSAPISNGTTQSSSYVNDFNVSTYDFDNRSGLSSCSYRIHNGSAYSLGWTSRTCNANINVDISSYCASGQNCTIVLNSTDQVGLTSSTFNVSVSITSVSSGAGFFITNNTNGNVALFDKNGNFYLKGKKNSNQGTLNAPANSFVLQNSSGTTIAYVNSTGSLFMRGSISEGSSLTGKTSSNLEFKNSTDNLIGFFDNQGNLKLKGYVVENYFSYILSLFNRMGLFQSGGYRK